MSAQNQTITGVLMGTPSYMSPEQIEAQPVDGRSDQFSLAVLAYELLTGVRPFVGESMATVAHHRSSTARPSARAANAALPPGREPDSGARSEPIPRSALPQLHRFCRGTGKGARECGTASAGESSQQTHIEIAPLCRCMRGSRGCGGRADIQRHQKPPPRSAPAPPHVPVPALKATPRSPHRKYRACSWVPVPVPVPVTVAAKPKPVPAAIRAQQLYKSAGEKRDQGKPDEARALLQQAAQLGDARAMEE